MRTTYSLPCLLAFCSQVLSLATPIGGYEVVIPQRRMEAHPGELDTASNGTVQDIPQTVTELSSGSERDKDYSYSGPERGELVAEQLLAKRTDFSNATISCGTTVRGPNAAIFSIHQGIRHLRKIEAHPYLGKGKTCSRVSCSWQSAIWWCNHGDEEQLLESFDVLADSAQYIVNECAPGYAGTPPHLGYYAPYVSGRLDHHEKWSVTVMYDANKC